MDGGKPFPINHGECKEDEFLAKSCQAMSDYMKRDPESVEFGIIVLAKKPN